jgi:hypothetical protein
MHSLAKKDENTEMQIARSVFASGLCCSLTTYCKIYRSFPSRPWSYLESTSGGVICGPSVTSKRSIRTLPSVMFARAPTDGPSCSFGRDKPKEMSSTIKIPRREPATVSLVEGGMLRGRGKITVSAPDDGEVSEYDHQCRVEEGE